MVRTIRYKQVLRERIGNSGGLYKSQVNLQRSFWREDQAHAWTIPKVRDIHSSIGTWDKHTRWFFFDYGYMTVNKIYTKGTSIFPKANYKPIKKAQEKRWKEQEQRALEFFESQGV